MSHSISIAIRIFSNQIHTLLLILGVALSSCGNSDISKAFSESEANRLLSVDSLKTWQLASRLENGTDVFDDCLDDRTLTFVNSSTLDSLYILGKPVNCSTDDIVDTLYKADYEIVLANSLFGDSLTLTNEKHAEIGYFAVEQLTSSILKLTYQEADIKVEERYSF